MKKTTARAHKVVDNLTTIALTVVKAKCAAVHFETMIAAH